jgi:hypothetical protein
MAALLKNYRSLYEHTKKRQDCNFIGLQVASWFRQRNDNEPMNEIKLLGVNSDRDTCDCCGRSSLKRVVWLSINGRPPVAYGVNCAAQTLGFKGRYSSADADRLKAKYKQLQKEKEAYERVCIAAQREADRLGENVCVIKDTSGHFYTRREAANKGYLFASPKAVFLPREAQAA